MTYRIMLLVELTAPSERLQNTPPAYFPAMVARRRQPMG